MTKVIFFIHSCIPYLSYFLEMSEKNVYVLQKNVSPNASGHICQLSLKSYYFYHLVNVIKNI